jgi:hypothetical protein
MPAIVTTNVSAVEEAARLAELPCFLKLNTYEDPGSTASWRASNSLAPGGGLDWSAGSSITDTNNPVRRAADQQPWTWTRPNGGQNGLRYLAFLMDLTQGTTDAFTINSFAMHVLNGDACPPNLDLTLEFAEDTDNSFTSPITVAQINDVDVNQKVISLTLGDGDDEYTNVKYARIIWDAPANWGSIAPQLSFVLLGKRRQLGHQPNETTDEEGIENLVGGIEAESGARSSHVFRENRAVLPLTFNLSSASQTGIDDIQVVRDFVRSDKGGTENFIYVDQPIPDAGWTNQLPRAHYMYMQDKNLNLRFDGVTSATWTNVFKELPPFQFGRAA